MNNDIMSLSTPRTRAVKVVYTVQTFHAHCPSCERSHKCHHEDDGSFTLVCGCMRDGIQKFRYLINASDVTISYETKFCFVDVPVEDSFESEWR